MSDNNFRDSAESVIIYIVIGLVIALIFELLPEGSYHFFSLVFWPVLFLLAIFKKNK